MNANRIPISENLKNNKLINLALIRRKFMKDQLLGINENI